MSEVVSTRLPGYDSLTGAQALAVTVAAPDGDLRVIATHVQPDTEGDDPTQQIDHVFVGDGVGVSDPRTRHRLTSDHRPVLVDLTLR